MIKDIFTLNPKSWHARLMEWMWDYPYYKFTNMCPYFWLSILNIVILVPYCIVRFLIKPVLKGAAFLITKVSAYCDRKRNEFEAQYREKLTKEIQSGNLNFDSGLYSRLLNEYENEWDSKLWDKMYDILDFETRKKLKAQVSEKYDLRRQAEKIKRESDEAYRKRKQEATQFSKRIKAAKYTGKGMLIVTSVLILYYAYVLIRMFIEWLIDIWNWEEVLRSLLVTLLIVAALFAIGGIIYFIQWLSCRLSYCLPCKARREKISDFFKSIFRFIFKPFVFIGKNLVAGIGFIVSMQRDNCPGIEWKEKE